MYNNAINFDSLPLANYGGRYNLEMENINKKSTVQQELSASELAETLNKNGSIRISQTN